MSEFRKLSPEEFKTELEIRGFTEKNGKSAVICYPVYEAYIGYLRGLNRLDEENEESKNEFLEIMKTKGHIPELRLTCRIFELHDSINKKSECMCVETEVFIGITPNEKEWQCLCNIVE